MKSTTRTLGEISDDVGGVIRTGPFGSQLHESDYVADGVPVVMPKDIVEGRVSANSIARVSEETACRLAQHRVHPGDIIYGRRGDIGRRALITVKESGWLCGTGCIRISLGESVLGPGFLYYYLAQPAVISWIANRAVGVTLPNLNTAILRGIPVIHPPLPTQRKIAAILSAYDDLIENNTRRIAILEEMARLLYREWFVDFRFPGHECVPTGESTLGDMACELRRAVGPAEVDEETPYVGLEHIPRRSIALGEWGSAKQVRSSKLRFNRGDILFGKIRPYFHKVVVAPVNGICSSDTIVIVPKDPIYFGLVVCLVSSDDFVAHASQTSQGTKMPRANWSVLAQYPVPFLPDPIMSQFNSMIVDSVGLIQSLTLANRVLCRTRDLLLPRLISGEIDVEDLDIDTEGVAA